MKHSDLRPSSRGTSSGRLLTAVWALVLTAAALPAGAAHPYYEDQLRRGTAALDQGDLATATQALRLAAFGMLDEPESLAGCLVSLTLAQRELGDLAAARETIERVIDLEERFQAYSQADLEAGRASRFEALLVEAVPATRLRTLPAFRGAARQRTLEELERLAPRQRTQRLGELVATEPNEPLWALMLARVEQGAGRYAQAITLIDQVLALSPDNASAYCVRGLARAGTADCSGAVDDLARCDRATVDAAIAWTQLDCLVQDERWVEALDFHALLPASVQAERRVRKLARRAENNRPQPDPAPAQIAAGDPTQPGSPPSTAIPPDPAPAAIQSAGPPRLSDADTARLQQARQALERARTVSDLADAWTVASGVADANPASREANRLTGEIAYRASRWDDAVTYFRRGAVGADDRPELLFYFAVSLWESGETAAAAAALEPALPRLRRTAFVNDYVERILGADSG